MIWDEYDGLTLGRHEKSRNALKVANWGAESSHGWIGSSWSLDSLDTVYCHHLPLLTIRCECLNLTGRAQELSNEEFVPDNSIVNPDTRY